MGLYSKWVTYGSENQYKGYLARMQNAKKGTPSVIVIQEIFGVDDHIQDITNRFAYAGYVAFAPDLFSHLNFEELNSIRLKEIKDFSSNLDPSTWGDPEKRLKELKLSDPVQSRRIQETLSKILHEIESNLFVRQLLDTSNYLKYQYDYSQGEKLASVGFCLGGFLSALLANESLDHDAAVIVYGNSPQKEKIQNIHCPILGIYGELDTTITRNVSTFAEWMGELNKPFEYEIYQGAHHGFFNDTRNSYNGQAVRQAFPRILEFLNKTM